MKTFNTPLKVKLFESPGKAGGLPILINHAIVGVSALVQTMFDGLRELSAKIRSKYPDTAILAGGHLASASSREILSTCPELDCVCFGEGEIPFREIVSQMANSDRESALLYVERG
jgi:radical SAM superfamily enzyme YgiQ (UPF0313 family)